MPNYSELVPALEDLMRRAGQIAREARQKLDTRLKSDGSVVTNADVMVDELLCSELPKLVGKTGCWGEESGFNPPGVNGLWAFDPVDGTSNFAFGSPLWGISVALVQGEDIPIASVYLPDFDEMYTSVQGHGAVCNGKPLGPIPQGKIKKHEIVSYCYNVVKNYPEVLWPGKMRCNGAFVVEGAWVAQQRMRAMVGIREKLYDIAGIVGVCREQNAQIRYADGSPFSLAELIADVKVTKAWLIFPEGEDFTVPTP
ncbi:MAG: hypothetical protein KF784_01255 [Fimbriimonadaceae bacterium]|nr:hypothetical protein [Fimbriimonadaceae bacterium]